MKSITLLFSREKSQKRGRVSVAMAAAVKHFRFLPVCVCVCVCVCVDSRPKAITSSGINDTARCAPQPRPGSLQLTGFCRMGAGFFEARV